MVAEKKSYTVQHHADGMIASINAPGRFIFRPKQWQQRGGPKFEESGYDEALGPSAALQFRAPLRSEREGGYYLLNEEALDRKVLEEDVSLRWETPTVCQAGDQCPFRRLGQCSGHLSTCHGRNR